MWLCTTGPGVLSVSQNCYKHLLLIHDRAACVFGPAHCGQAGDRNGKQGLACREKGLRG